MKKTARLIELCAGYSSQLLALKRLKQYAQSIGEDIDVECVAWSEFDPDSKRPNDEQPAVIAHKMLHPECADRNLGDMTKIDWLKFKAELMQGRKPLSNEEFTDLYTTAKTYEEYLDTPTMLSDKGKEVMDWDANIDILTYSTPCQSISNAGLQHGFEPGSGTRSSILWDTLKCIEVMRPKYLLQENVAAIVSEKFLPMFNAWQLAVEKLGYRNYTQLMNAKEYGVPQNRNRLFMLSVRDDLELQYKFPTPFKLDKTLEDVLEKNVDEHYYIAQEKTDEWIAKERERLEKEGLI